MTYTLTANGLDADLDIEWLRNGTMATSYLGMATWEHMRRDGGSGVWVSFDTTERARWDNEPDFSTGANDGTVHSAPSLTSAISLWEDAAPNYANSWVVGHWVKSIPAITKLWLQDRSGQLDKVYPEIESGAPAGGPFTAGQTLKSSVRYCAKPFTNPGATFGS